MIYEIIVFMALFLVIGVLFIALAQPMQVVYSETYNLSATLIDNATLVAEVQGIQDNIMTMFWLAPFVMLLALILWLFVRAQKKEYDYYPQY